MKFFSVAGGLLPVTIACAQEVIIPLNGGWMFRQDGDTTLRSAEVPGTAQSDLIRQGVIPDPFHGGNIDSIQWVGDREWVYFRTIMADEALLQDQHIDLVFEGLDTFAEILLNGSILGTTDNMFRTWEFPIRDRLRPGSNDLQVIFHPAVREGERLREAYGIQLPHDNDPSGASPYVRKAAYQFGWDFAPRLITCGIWRPVELRCWNTARIDQVSIHPVMVGTSAVVGVEAYLDGSSSDPMQLVLDIDGDRTTVPVPMGELKEPIRASISIEDAQRWWPHGEGEQVLYPVRVELLRKGRSISTWEARTGLRTVALDQHEGAFTFIVNGEPLFMKGANLVPPAMLLPSVGDQPWIDLVRDAQRANMNMLRVWAGGVYPPDAFFTSCDTAGILVWQDFMFANMVPGSTSFIENVKREADEQVLRIGSHPCLALWCGNNELAMAWQHWGWQDRYGLHGSDSVQVEDATAELVSEALGYTTTGVPYTPTSPLSNWGDAEGLRTGDLHYWGVWHGDSAFSSFANNVGRFVSEYGFQSYPDSSILAEFIDPKDLHLGSPELARRQRSYKTDRPIWDAIQREFGAAPKSLGEFILYSQLAQADAYRQAIWAHRTSQPHCMGTLFWQLNDCWPGPSWSAIDLAGRWKPVMREVQRGYAPIVLQLSREGDRLLAEVWNDGPATHAELILRIVHTDRTLVSIDTIPAEVGHGLGTIWSGNSRGMIGNDPPDRCLLIAELAGTEGEDLWRALPLVPWNDMRWTGPAVKATQALQASPGEWLKGH